jgi:hypothetical protein
MGMATPPVNSLRSAPQRAGNGFGAAGFAV